MQELHGGNEEREFSVIATASASLSVKCHSLLSAYGDIYCVTHRNDLEQYLSPPPAILLVVDLNLPGLSGVSGIETLLRGYPALPVLVITDKVDDETALALLRSGVSGYCPTEKMEKELAKALQVILDGEIWAERRIVSRLLNEMRSRGGPRAPVTAELVEKLTPRERDITKLVSEGLCQKSIANYLDISENTVRNHLRNIFDKTRVSSRLQLALLVKGG
jgi:DNA-binding NarL/FixJ family response regulator